MFTISQNRTPASFPFPGYFPLFSFFFPFRLFFAPAFGSSTAEEGSQEPFSWVPEVILHVLFHFFR